MRTNYHAHTARCNHASGTEEAYVLTAIDNGFSTLGFSDHTPWPFADGYTSGVRMRVDELDDYVATVRRLADAYTDRIRILCGLECENYTTMLPWLREQKERLSIDYLIFGNHFKEPEIERRSFVGNHDIGVVTQYVKTAIDALQTGMFAYMAHPDIVLFQMEQWSPAVSNELRELCRAAKALDVPLEYNLLGMQPARRPQITGKLGYPNTRFWELAAAEGCTAIVGVDAHAPDHMAQADAYDTACAYLDSLGIVRIKELL